MGREASTGHGATIVLCSWEGNRRSSVTLGTQHRLCAISTCWLSGLRKGDELPAYNPVGTMAPFTFYFCCDSWWYRILALDSRHKGCGVPSPGNSLLAQERMKSYASTVILMGGVGCKFLPLALTFALASNTAHCTTAIQVDFCEALESDTLRARHELVKFWKLSGTHCGYIVVFIDSPLVSWCEKWKWSWKNQFYGSVWENLDRL